MEKSLRSMYSTAAEMASQVNQCWKVSCMNNAVPVMGAETRSQVVFLFAQCWC